MPEVLKEIVRLLVSGISEMATGIGQGLGSLVTNIFLEVGENGAVEGLSVFGGVAITFAGISLCIGLSKLIVHWITSLGSSNI